MAMANWWFSCSACRWFSTLGGLLHSPSGYVYSQLQRGLLVAGKLAPSKNLHISHISHQQLVLFSLHSLHCSLLRWSHCSLRKFLSLPLFLHVHEHIEFTLDRATSIYTTGGPSISTRTRSKYSLRRWSHLRPWISLRIFVPNTKFANSKLLLIYMMTECKIKHSKTLVFWEINKFCSALVGGSSPSYGSSSSRNLILVFLLFWLDFVIDHIVHKPTSTHF